MREQFDSAGSVQTICRVEPEIGAPLTFPDRCDLCRTNNQTPPSDSETTQMRPFALLTVLLTALTACAPSRVAMAQTDEPVGEETAEDESKMNAGMFAAIGARSVGPAVASGRIGDIAVNPHDFSEWYVAVSSGGVWKTTNNGATFSPIFDDEGSYSIGCVTIDPNNTNVVWVGTGENNSQRSVSFGDGVYKSVDGGKSWKNVGLP